MNIWYISDTKAGHTAQVNSVLQGLTLAGVDYQLKVISVDTLSVWRLFAIKWQMGVHLTKACIATNTCTATSHNSQEQQNQAVPNLIIGCGHATHVYILLLAKLYPCARSLLVLSPSLPVRWFDLLMVPQHDNPMSHPSHYVFDGALTNLHNVGMHIPDRHIILLGGVSKRFQWSNSAVAACIEQIVNAYPNCEYELSVSRRTPDSVWAMPILSSPKLISHHLYDTQTTQNWVGTQLHKASVAWITQDSVSMIFEALQAGCIVVVIPLLPYKSDRITRLIDGLIHEGRVFTLHTVLHNPHVLTVATSHQNTTKNCEDSARGVSQGQLAANWLLRQLAPIANNSEKK